MILAITICFKLHNNTHDRFDNKTIRDYNKGNFIAINTELRTFFKNTMSPSFYKSSVDQNWLLFKNTLCTLIDAYVPLVAITNDKLNP